jgi:hypothetical protein
LKYVAVESLKMKQMMTGGVLGTKKKGRDAGCIYGEDIME